MTTIGDVLARLTPKQRERLADRRGVTVRGLGKSYRQDWVELVKDLSASELRRALRVLSDRELRIVVLRALDGRHTGLEGMVWNDDGTAQKRRKARGIVEALCNWAPRALQARTWSDVIAKMLRDVGLASVETPTGNDDLVRLRQIFQ